jgi:hypothetical protein
MNIMYIEEVKKLVQEAMGETALSLLDELTNDDVTHEALKGAVCGMRALQGTIIKRLDKLEAESK